MYLQSAFHLPSSICCCNYCNCCFPRAVTWIPLCSDLTSGKEFYQRVFPCTRSRLARSGCPGWSITLSGSSLVSIWASCSRLVQHCLRLLCSCHSYLLLPPSRLLAIGPAGIVGQQFCGTESGPGQLIRPQQAYKAKTGTQPPLLTLVSRGSFTVRIIVMTVIIRGHDNADPGTVTCSNSFRLL